MTTTTTSYSPQQYDTLESKGKSSVPSIYGANGALIDFNENCDGPITWGMGIDKKDRADIISAYTNTMGQIDIATIQYHQAINQACIEASAAVESARTTAEAEMYKADKEYDAIHEQCKTDLDIAKVEQETELAKLEVEKQKVEDVDTVNAQANLLSAQALMVESEGKKAKDEGQGELDAAKANDLLSQ